MVQRTVDLKSSECGRGRHEGKFGKRWSDLSSTLESLMYLGSLQRADKAEQKLGSKSHWVIMSCAKHHLIGRFTT